MSKNLGAEALCWNGVDAMPLPSKKAPLTEPKKK